MTGGGFTLACANPGSYSYVAPNYTVSFTNLCTYEAEIDAIQSPQLPGDLPDGSTLVQALQIVVTEDGQGVNPLPAGSSVSVKYELPAGQDAGSYSILLWQDGEWVELDAALDDDGFFSASSVQTGTFILVKK